LKEGGGKQAEGSGQTPDGLAWGFPDSKQFGKKKRKTGQRGDKRVTSSTFKKNTKKPDMTAMKRKTVENRSRKHLRLPGENRQPDWSS